MTWDNREMIRDSDFPAAVYKVLNHLVKEESFEDSVIFERPKIRHKKDVESSLEDLEWAAKNRRFWFMGPYDWIRFDRKSEPLEGSLFTGENTIVFKILVKTDEAEKLLQLFKQQNLEVDLQEMSPFTVELSIWDKKPFSPENITEFITKLKSSLAKRKPKHPR